MSVDDSASVGMRSRSQVLDVGNGGQPSDLRAPRPGTVPDSDDVGGPDGSTPGPSRLRLQVRLLAPGSPTVLVRAAGPLDAASTPVFVETVAAAFGAAVHIVVDLSEVTALTQAGLQALLDLDRVATHHGTQLHITGAAHPQTSHHVAGHLLRLGTDHLLRLAESVDCTAPHDSAAMTTDAPAEGSR